MKLLIKYPSRGRPDMFRKAIQNIFATVKSPDFTVLVSIDENDESMNNSTVKNWLLSNYSDRVRVVVGNSRNKIDAVNRDMQEAGEWDWLVVMSDDMAFVQDGWDSKMLSKVKAEWGDSLDWFAHFNDGHVGHKLPTMSIMGREYYERFFYIYPPCYGSIQCDGEVMFVAMMLQRYRYWPDVYFLHNHVANIGGPPDHVFLANEKFGDNDVLVYERRKKKLFYVNNPSFNPLNADGTWDGEKPGYDPIKTKA